jgi:eukaryotic-like serine/threonine-protein kinase
MEFIEGTPLLSNRNPGPLPWQEALEYAGQILDALDAAHRKGIIHRDLKPANIMVTKQGIKLLDFGLAKQTSAVWTAGSEDVTMTTLSVEGQISGTLQYMAPEQLEGKPADARSDIFAFGLVLYEMIGGQRPFTGESAARTIASIMKEQPRPLNELQPLAPPGLDPIVQTCLEKDPDKRWQSAREVKHALTWMARNSVSSAVPQAPVTAPFPAKKLRLWQCAAAVLGLAAVGLGGGMFRPEKEQPAPITRFEVPLPYNVNFGQYVALSPNGRKVVINTTGTRRHVDPRHGQAEVATFARHRRRGESILVSG